MTDPYVVLGVARTASDDEVKTAYRNLAKKYHPDNYANTPDIADVAADKMREVNEAYDTIVKERKGGNSGKGPGSSAGYSSSSYSGSSYNSSSNAGSSQSSYSSSNYGAGSRQSSQSQNTPYQNTYSTTSSFADIRRLIMDNRFDDANAVLDGVPTDRRNAEWNFLKGTVLYHRGWLEQAYTYLQAAVNMEPGNSEFRAAFNQASKMRSGAAGGYKVGKSGGDGCNPCNMCCSLMCMDQCCECCGGDLISCC